MHTHLYKSKNNLFLSTHIRNVVSHINATTPAASLQIVTQLDDTTLVRVNGRLFDLPELTNYFRKKARNDGFTFDDKISVIVRGTVVQTATDKTHTLACILMDKIAEGQQSFAYDDYAHDYTKRQFITAIYRAKDKLDFNLTRKDKKYYTNLPLAYAVVSKTSPNNHQNITDLDMMANWAIANAKANA